LKQLLTSAPILRIADPNEDFVVCTDACKEGLGGVFSQNGFVICYESIKLKEHERNYATHDLELVARFCGPFEILERIGPVAYMLALPASMIVHNVFHISFLKKYILDANHVIDWNVIQVEQEGVL
jgi:hypothetical protein